MKRVLLFGLLLFILIPHSVGAAWWKPTTWKIFTHRAAKTQIENSTTTAATASEIESLKKEIEQLKKQQAKPAEAKAHSSASNMAAPASKPVSQPSTTSGSEALYKKVVEKYNELKNQVRSDISVIKETVELTDVQKKRLEYLNGFVNDLNKDIDELNKLSSKPLKPLDTLDFYGPKIDRIIQDYAYEKKQYGQSVISETKASEAKECMRAKDEYKKAFNALNALISAYDANSSYYESHIGALTDARKAARVIMDNICK